MSKATSRFHVKTLAASVLIVIASTTAPVASSQPGAEEVVTIDGRVWSLEIGEGATPWSDAEEFCAGLENGGFSDWRLPSLLELESLHDPDSATGLKGPFQVPDCCAWSSENLVEQPTDRKGNLPDQTGPAAAYYWGFLFEGGISYYSMGGFPDGFALCTRD